MGTDTPISALSDKSKLLYTYFKQNFAQVTNPPIDPIREELVMSLVSFIGPRPNILDLEGTSRQKRLEVRQPILTNEDLEKIRSHRPFRGRVRHQDPRHHLPGRAGRGRHGRRPRPAVRPGRSRGARRLQHHRALGPRRRAGPDRHPGAARLRRRPQLPDPQGLAHLGRTRGRVRRAARGASLRLPRRLRRRGDQPLPRVRDAARHARTSFRPRWTSARSSTATSSRSTRACSRSCPRWASRPTSPTAARRSSTPSGCGPTSSTATSSARRRRSKASAWPRSPRRRVRRHRDAFGDAPVYRHALDVGGEYAYRLRGEDPCLEPGHGRHAPACRAARTRQDHYRDVRAAGERARKPPQDAARPVPHQDRRGDRPQPRFRWRRSSRRRRSCRRFSTGAMSFGSISQGGARDAGARHERHRRQVEHRRGRRGAGALPAAAGRALAALARSSRWPRAASA